ncbi:glycosyltransferase family 1 protein [Glaciihabitans sp. dw_435]|uniref:glycosyltransferase family 4 protein n=1 Tax=Glaciihabitans sp. dw_435 TaxID=2720081 RepID=UPI001BD5EFCA|nr:glycosyltransferase family 1 protein [Glaciihabitans sp. dw_435]
MKTQPHILVDATAIPGNRGGVGRYLEHLIPALARLDARITVISQPRDVRWLSASSAEIRVVPSPAAGRSRPLRLLWEQVGLPRAARRMKADVVFSPHYTMPLLSSIPTVVTLHDATFFSHPELHSRAKRLFFRWWSATSLRRAAACIVPSEATKSELLRWVKPARDTMHVAYHGVDSERFHPPTAAETREANEYLAGVPRWIAFLGTLEPRKNVSNLVRAFQTVVTADTAGTAGLSLLLAGGRGWDADLARVIEESTVADRVRMLGFVDDSLLAGVLGGADLVAYPSLGEGFGLPVLEAMACGVPVITTALLALPEVGGDVAVYTEPDAPSIAVAIQSLLADAPQRAERGQRGIERARLFTWDASAAAHLTVFSESAVS